MYHYKDKQKRSELNKHLKELEIKLFERYRDNFNPEYSLPFAGKYWLGGPLIELNDERAISDAVDTKLLPNSDNIIILDDWDEDGGSYFDCKKRWLLEESAKLLMKIKKASSYLKSLKWTGYEYEKEIKVPTSRLPLFNALLQLIKLVKNKSKLSI